MGMRPALLFLLVACAAPDAPKASTFPTGAIEDVRAGRAYQGVSPLEAWLEQHGRAPAEDRVEVLRWAAHGRTLMQEPDLALIHFDQALMLEPTDPWLNYGRGMALQSLGRIEHAIEAYSAAIAYDPTHIKALQWRGFTRALLGQRTLARRDYQAALNLIDAADPATLAEWDADPVSLRAWIASALERLDR